MERFDTASASGDSGSRDLRLYAAPLEGITGYAWRNAQHALFTGIDRYFTPFLAPNHTHNFKTREKEDIAPANNACLVLVPQILSNRAEDFLWAAGEIRALGYREINLNLGCPMPTVVRRGRGAGQLADLDALDRFLEQVCTGLGLGSGSGSAAQCQPPHCSAQQVREGAAGAAGSASAGTSFADGGLPPAQPAAEPPVRLSVKTRIGVGDSRQAGELLAVYNRYPIAELTVHPRTQRDLYGNTPDLDAFAMFLEGSAHPVVYNGDIFTADDYRRFHARFPQCAAVMLGRGLIADPALAREIRGGEPLTKEELREFHDAVFCALQQSLPGTAPLVGKMKELWFYMARNFDSGDPGVEKGLKAVRKARDLVQYRAAARALFACRWRQQHFFV